MHISPKGKILCVYVCMSVGACVHTFYERCVHVNFSYLFLLLLALFFWFMYCDRFLVALKTCDTYMFLADYIFFIRKCPSLSP